MWTVESELATTRLTVRAAPKRLSLSGDEHLARLVRRGNEAAFAALYERYYQRLYRYCRSMLHNDADAQDALQSAFAGAFSALAQGRREAPMRPWLYRIAYNESVSILRRRRADVALTEAHETPAASTEEQAAERARLALLVADLGHLTERQRGALVMRELSGLSHEEIATAFGISVGAAKQTIFEARRSLAEFAEGRAMACDDICRAVSDGHGRVLRGRRVRAHLRECGSCAAFAAAIPARSHDLRAIAPPLSAVAAAALLRQALAGSSHSAGGGTAVGTAAGSGAAASSGAGSGAATLGGAGTGVAGSGSATVAAGAMTKVAGLGLIAKAATGVAVLATAAAGLAGAVNHIDSSSQGTASSRALHMRQAQPAGAAAHPASAGVVSAGGAAANSASHRRSTQHRTTGRDRGAGHHGSLATPQANTGRAQANSRGAAPAQGAAHGVSGAKPQGAAHSSVTGTAQSKARSNSASVPHASPVRSNTTKSLPSRPTHRRSPRSAAHGGSPQSGPAAGASAPGSQPAAGASAPGSQPAAGASATGSQPAAGVNSAGSK